MSVYRHLPSQAICLLRIDGRLQPAQALGAILLRGVNGHSLVLEGVFDELGEVAAVGGSDHGLFVRLHERDWISRAAPALIEDERVGEAEKGLVLGDPGRDFHTAHLLSDVEVVEADPMSAVPVLHERIGRREDR